MPALGYGLYKVDPEEAEIRVGEAIRAGYRLIDTARLYGTKKEQEQPLQRAEFHAKNSLSSQKYGSIMPVKKMRIPPFLRA